MHIDSAMKPDASLVHDGGSGRFDWWAALVRVLSSVEAVRDGRALYVLLTAFCAAGWALSVAAAAFGNAHQVEGVAVGAAALFIAFYGTNAAGLLCMDRAMGRRPREVGRAVRDALQLGHWVLLSVCIMLALGAVVAALLLGLVWLCGWPGVGPMLFVVVVPLTVFVASLVFLAGAVVVAPLTGPVVWSGAGLRLTLTRLGQLMRRRLLQAAVLVAGLSLATGAVAGAVSALVLMGGRLMAQASVLILGVDIPPEALMAGLFGRGVQIHDAGVVGARALGYISAATVGGGVVFAVALVLPTVVYLRGVCEVYLALRSELQGPHEDDVVV